MLKWLVCAIAILGLWLGAPAPAFARLQQQVEAPGQILYQSRHQLRDRNLSTWQVVLFKRVDESERANTIDLRLVGFPGRAEFQHPQDLVLAAGDRLWQATDRFATEAPAPNVGQFDLAEIVPQLPSDRALELTIPIEGAPALKIPIPVIVEWQVVAAS